LPEDELPEFISGIARRIARFPKASVADAKRRVNAIALPDVEALRDDSQLFLSGLGRPEHERGSSCCSSAGCRPTAPSKRDSDRPSATYRRRDS